MQTGCTGPTKNSIFRFRDRWKVALPATLAAVLIGAAPLLAQSTSATQPADGPAPATAPAEDVAEPAGPLPGPKYASMRQNDDFSYLDGPEGSYKKDLFDPIKRIHLTDDLTMRLGGEIRGRMEAMTHQRFGAEPTPEDTFFLHRYYYHADVQYRKLARFFVEGVSADIEDHDGTVVPNPSDHFDAHQMFADLRFLGEEVPLTFRGGRFELELGRQRLVSPLDWANVRRAWDGAMLFWHDQNIWIDGFYARPVVVKDKSVDDNDEDVSFFGLYTTWKGIPNHEIDIYYLGLNNTTDTANANVRTGDVGDLTVHTIGSRFGGKTPVGVHTWDYDTELAGQWGTWAGDVIQAWMWSGETGYTLSNLPWVPRVGAGLDYASGDADPYDGAHQTFNQLFPFGHYYLGYLDEIGRQNIWAQRVEVSAKPIDPVTCRIAWHTFWTDKNRDALYNAAGARTRRSINGGVGDEIGHELDLTVNWQVDPHASVLFGYSHFWASDFIFGTGPPDEDPDLLYVQYRYQF